MRSYLLDKTRGMMAVSDHIGNSMTFSDSGVQVSNGHMVYLQERIASLIDDAGVSDTRDVDERP